MNCTNHLPEFSGRDDMGAYFTCRSCGEMELMETTDYLDWLHGQDDDERNEDEYDFDLFDLHEDDM